MKTVVLKSVSTGIGAATLAALLAGCGATPEPPTTQQRQQSVETHLQSIQNNPNMPLEAKQRAIAGIKAQQNHTSVQPISVANSPSVESQIRSIQNNPNMPPEAKQRAIEGIQFQQRRTTTNR